MCGVGDVVVAQLVVERIVRLDERSSGKFVIVKANKTQEGIQARSMTPRRPVSMARIAIVFESITNTTERMFGETVGI